MNFDYNRAINNAFIEDKEQCKQNKLLKFEAKFLPSPVQLSTLANNKKKLSNKYEAMIEIRYLTDICLHHRRRYYRLSEPLITDVLYDMLENRLEYLGKLYPELVGKDHPVLHRVGY